MSKATPRSRRRTIVFGVITVFCIWGFFELLGLAFWFLEYEGPEEDLRAIFRAHPYRAYSLTPDMTNRMNTRRHNSKGIRGPEFDAEKSSDTIRLLCIGGSTTVGFDATTNTHTYPARMGALLDEHYAGAPFRVQVINAGVDAANSMHNLVYLESRLIDYEADLAIFHNCLNDAVIMAIRPEYRSDYAHARTTYRLPDPKWWEFSPFLSYFFARDSIQNPWFPNRTPDLNYLILKGGQKVGLDWAHEEAQLTPYMVASYERNLRSTLAVARGNGIRPVFATQVIYDDSLSGGPVINWYRQLAAVMRRIAREEAVPLIDFEAAMDWSAERFVDSCHLKDSPEGLGAKARIFADALIEMNLIDEVWQDRQTTGPVTAD